MFTVKRVDEKENPQVKAFKNISCLRLSKDYPQNYNFGG